MNCSLLLGALLLISPALGQDDPLDDLPEADMGAAGSEPEEDSDETDEDSVTEKRGCGRRKRRPKRTKKLPASKAAGVTAALVGGRAGDLDIFLTCAAEEGEARLRDIYAAVQR